MARLLGLISPPLWHAPQEVPSELETGEATPWQPVETPTLFVADAPDFVPLAVKQQQKQQQQEVQEKQEQQQDAAPVEGKVYRGRVTGTVDFGCFVLLEGVRGRWEGLVHVSQMSHPSGARGATVARAQDAVRKGQAVFVKVKRVIGNKMSLSMREADQTTGQDLLPAKTVDEKLELLRTGLESMPSLAAPTPIKQQQTTTSRSKQGGFHSRRRRGHWRLRKRYLCVPNEPM